MEVHIDIFSAENLPVSTGAGTMASINFVVRVETASSLFLPTNDPHRLHTAQACSLSRDRHAVHPDSKTPGARSSQAVPKSHFKRHIYPWLRQLLPRLELKVCSTNVSYVPAQLDLAMETGLGLARKLFPLVTTDRFRDKHPTAGRQ